MRAVAYCVSNHLDAKGITTQLVASGLASPILGTAPPGDTSRLFIAEQGTNGSASIKILNLTNNTINATPFLTISGIPTNGEQGLLGMAFDPNYATNGYFYVDYIAAGGAYKQGVTHIQRFHSRVTQMWPMRPARPRC